MLSCGIDVESNAAGMGAFGGGVFMTSNDFSGNISVKDSNITGNTGGSWTQVKSGPSLGSADDGRAARRQEAFVHRTCFKELELLAKPDAIETEVKERRFIEHTLQICVHAAQDVREDPAPPSKYATEPVPYPPDQAVLRGLRKTPSERFQSAVEFRHEVWSPSLW